ncbi:MAG TPA: ABC transporter substrate-binding protein [Acidimicrobiales bacterium]|nr:ABC transporter substrate-binding protein [Acidimicrobiales bacterium]
MISGLRSAPRHGRRLCVALALLVPMAAAPVASGSPPAGALAGRGATVPASQSAPPAPPRDQTLYTTGTSSEPPTNFNPLAATSYTGTQGLLYEPLFLYDPLHQRFVPWLATDGTWTTPTSYRLEVRDGVDWVSSATGAVTGRLSAADVAYGIKLAASSASDPYHADLAGVRSVAVSGNAVTVDFAKPVGYAQWQEFLWHAPVLPSEIWQKLPTGGDFDNPVRSPVSTGPMLLYSTGQNGACYRDNPHWWATAQLRLSFTFGYLCDLVSSSSGTGLSDLLADKVDWSNQLLRGIINLADSKGGGYDIKTYYAGPPYMIPATTAWLQMDLAKAPMDNPDFRLAAAYALDTKTIASTVYTGAVEPANPTGLLPELSSYIDTSAVHKYGFYYSLSLAKRYLAKSGYNGAQLKLLVPYGFPDLSSAATLITQQLGKVGIHVSVSSVPAAARANDVATGDYDMVINDPVGLGSTPWSYFDTVYQLPIGPDEASGANSERFSSPSDWALVQEAGDTPLTDTAALDGIYANLEIDFLKELPEIPLWYNGAWFQGNTKLWQGYPSSTSSSDSYTPVMWRGWLGATTTVLALAAIKLSVSHGH